ncbi:MAG TPA: VWA domain-containing protein [Agitococcus sp.]|nr:VWA domain-containing protein [Agitococcus sp.]HNI63477.1 VWA domain-containing protein [Agitococcus sp.]
MMINANYLFTQTALAVGTQGTTDVLLRFNSLSTNTTQRQLNIALVIDRSGSMAGSSLKYALDAAQNVIDQLSPTDIISVVAFDDVISTIISPQHAINKQDLKQRIRQIRAGGTTNLSGGWLEGCKHVQTHYNPTAINRVLLLTDGQANEGITDKRILTNTAAKKAEQGIITTTLGFGANFEEDLLISIAKAAQGNFYFIQSKDEASQVFSIELESLKSVVAQNLTATLTPIGNVSIEQCLTSHHQEKIGNTMTISLGDVYANEDKLLGLTLNLPCQEHIGLNSLLSVTFSADIVNHHHIEQVHGELTVNLPIVSVEEAAIAPSTGVRIDIARLKIACAKDTALRLADQKQFVPAQQTLISLISQLQQQGLHEHFEIAEEIEQLNYFATRIANRNLSNETRKELRDQSFQGFHRNRMELNTRGIETSPEITQLKLVSDIGTGIELICVREHGKLRIKINNNLFDSSINVQFPRAIRAEGAKYVVEDLEPSADGSFYRVKGAIHRLVGAGETDIFQRPQRDSIVRTGKASKVSISFHDLEVADSVGDCILVQCVNDGSKLRARVVSDGFDPTWNMRFPRSIREEGMLYVVDEVITGPDGKSYIACGKVKRFEQI